MLLACGVCVGGEVCVWGAWGVCGVCVGCEGCVGCVWGVCCHLDCHLIRSRRV